MKLHGLKEFFLQEVFANIYSFIVERTIRDNYNKEKDNDDTLLMSRKSITEIKATLNSYEEKEIQRKKTIEEKARASLFVVALSVTISMTTLGLLKDFHWTGIMIAAITFFVIAILYLIIASITAIKAINIGEFHSLSLLHFIERKDGKLKKVKISNAEKTADLYRYVILNQLTNNIKANYVYATFIGIRNGIVLLAFFFFILLVSPRSPSNYSMPQFQISNTKISISDSTPTCLKSETDSVNNKNVDTAGANIRMNHILK